MKTRIHTGKLFFVFCCPCCCFDLFCFSWKPCMIFYDSKLPYFNLLYWTMFSNQHIRNIRIVWYISGSPPWEGNSLSRIWANYTATSCEPENQAKTLTQHLLLISQPAWRRPCTTVAWRLVTRAENMHTSYMKISHTDKRVKASLSLKVHGVCISRESSI